MRTIITDLILIAIACFCALEVISPDTAEDIVRDAYRAVQAATRA